MNLTSETDSFDIIERQAFQEHNARLLEQLESCQRELDILNQQIVELESDNQVLEQGNIALQQKMQSQQPLFDCNPTPLAIINRHGDIQSSNLAFETFLQDQELDSKIDSLKDLFNHSNMTRFRNQFKATPDMNGVLLLLLSNTVVLVSTRALPNCKKTHYLLQMQPAGFEKNSYHNFRLSKVALDQMKEGLLVTDANQKILMINKSFTEITGYTSEEVIGERSSILKSGCHKDEFYDQMYSQLQSTGWWTGEIWNKRKNGTIYPEWLQISRVYDDYSAQTFYIASFSDITERKNHQERLDKLAFFDSLTGLPNRTSMQNHLDSLLSRSKQNMVHIFAVIFLDLDKFKEVNDTFGHQEGDFVLKEASQRIISCIRNDDFASRIGGG